MKDEEKETTAQEENTVDIDTVDAEELTVDDEFYDESDDDIDNYYSNLHKKK